MSDDWAEWSQAKATVGTKDGAISGFFKGWGRQRNSCAVRMLHKDFDARIKRFLGVNWPDKEMDEFARKAWLRVMDATFKEIHRRSPGTAGEYTINQLEKCVQKGDPERMITTLVPILGDPDIFFDEAVFDIIVETRDHLRRR